jgi:hypothetical protein
MFNDLRAKAAAKLAERKGTYVGIGAFLAGAQGGPLAAKGAEYVGPYVIDALVKVLGG